MVEKDVHKTDEATKNLSNDRHDQQALDLNDPSFFAINQLQSSRSNNVNQASDDSYQDASNPHIGSPHPPAYFLQSRSNSQYGNRNSSGDSYQGASNPHIGSPHPANFLQSRSNSQNGNRNASDDPYHDASNPHIGRQHPKSYNSSAYQLQSRSNSQNCNPNASGDPYNSSRSNSQNCNPKASGDPYNSGSSVNQSSNCFSSKHGKDLLLLFVINTLTAVILGTEDRGLSTNQMLLLARFVYFSPMKSNDKLNMI